MTAPLDALIAKAKLAAEQAPGKTDRTAQREQLQRLAAEFESMLMSQVLKDMRRAGKWDDSDEGSDSLGAQSLFEMLDAELASTLAKAQGFGLSAELLDAFDRMGLEDGAAITGREGATVGGTYDTLTTPAVAGQAVTGGDVKRNTPPQVTSDFGWRRDPLTGQARFHKGVDLKAAYGQEVQAAGGGRVVYSGPQGSYGTTVLIEHADGTRTRYAHLSVALVTEGDTVATGQAVGRAGSTGRSTGPHLHFEVLAPNGRPLDPLNHRVG